MDFVKTISIFIPGILAFTMEYRNRGLDSNPETGGGLATFT
jgi:hypothetical protein